MRLPSSWYTTKHDTVFSSHVLRLQGHRQLSQAAAGSLLLMQGQPSNGTPHSRRRRLSRCHARFFDAALKIAGKPIAMEGEGGLGSLSSLNWQTLGWCEGCVADEPNSINGLDIPDVDRVSPCSLLDCIAEQVVAALATTPECSRKGCWCR